MFSFSMDKNVPLDTTPNQLAHHGIGKDSELEQSLRDSGDWQENERYFRAENERPETVEAAVEFVLGIFFRAPRRVWLAADPVEVTAGHLEAVRKPTA